MHVIFHHILTLCSVVFSFGTSSLYSLDIVGGVGLCGGLVGRSDDTGEAREAGWFTEIGNKTQKKNYHSFSSEDSCNSYTINHILSLLT
jgi:hypothetical protein